MKNNPLYDKLKQIALDGDYTVEQVQNATVGQIATLLGASGQKPQFIENMRRGIINTLQNRDDEVNLRALKSQAIDRLNSNFPDFAAERGREGDKPFVKIWLKGKPNG